MSDAHQLVEDERGLAVVFGLPGLRTRAAVEALQTTTLGVFQECSIGEINSRFDWEEACSSRQHFIAISQYPSPDMCAHIEGTGAPVLIVTDNPMHSVAQLVAELHSGISAVRAVSASISCLAGMMAQPESEIRAANARNVGAFLVQLTRASGINAGIRDPKRIADHARELSVFGGASKNLPDVSSLTRKLCRLAEPALAQLAEGRVEWPGSLFFLGDFPDTPMRGPVDLAGPARCLLYGPYMHLLVGRWNACITVAIAGIQGGQSFTVEVACNEVIAGGRFHCEGPGLFEIRIDFAHRNPHLPIELRVFLDEGAIYGTLNRFDVKLKLSH
jgi:hypothetical protein